MIHLLQICLNFLDFFHRLGDKEILWGKRNFGDCKRIFEQAVVEALSTTDNSHYRLIFYLGKKYTFVLRAEIATTFGPKMVAISARNTKEYRICKLCKTMMLVMLL